MSSRLFLKGTDDRTSSSIRGQADYVARLERQSWEHELHRLEAIAEALALFAVMTRAEVVKSSDAVLAEKAIFQWGKGTRADATQAAHCLPGQPTFAGFPSHQLAGWREGVLHGQGLKPLALASKLRNVCGQTDLVDKDVNRVDSDLEIMTGGRGLKALFADAIQRLIARGDTQPGTPWESVRRGALAEMTAYRQRAATLYDERMRALPAAPTLAPGAAPTGDAVKRIVLRAYKRVLLTPAVTPEPLSPGEFRLRVVNEVVQGA